MSKTHRANEEMCFAAPKALQSLHPPDCAERPLRLTALPSKSAGHDFVNRDLKTPATAAV